MFVHHPSKTPLAVVTLEGIVCDMEIGILPSEQGRTQRITFDVSVGFPDSMTRIADTEADLTDRGFDTRLVRAAISAACVDKAGLLETIANDACDRLLAIPGALTVQLKISKSYTWADTEKTSLLISRIK
jgi:dihydroneopterin aldolase